MTAQIKSTLSDLNEFTAAKSATRQLAGETYVLNGTLITKWGVEEVSNWLVTIGYNDLVPIFHRSNINGLALSRLNENLLKEIGVLNVGTRLQFMNEVLKIQAISRSDWRNHIIWSEDEFRPNWCCFLLPYSFPCCCCADTWCGKRDVYTLTNSRINILHEKKKVNTPCTGCCGFMIMSDNIDLTLISDIDCGAETNSCGEPQGQVIISLMSGEQKNLTLRSSDCQKVTAIFNSVREEAVVSAHLVCPGIVR
jgi:hypothetical protein